MAELTITIQNLTGGGIAAGFCVQAGDWSAGFGHAALVTALRSRANAYDFSLRHLVYGSIPLIAVSGANSAAAKVTWNLPAILIAGDTDASYRLTIGNLGAQVSPFGAVAGSHVPGLSVSASVSALTLPAPGFPFGADSVNDVVESPGYPVHRRAINANARTVRRLSWANLLPEDWYAIQAFEHSVRGTAGTFTAPSWIGGSALYRFREPVAYVQSSRLGFAASAVICEEIA